MRLTPELIQDTVAEYYGITAKELLSKTQKGPIVRARHISIYFIKELMKLSWFAIANYYSYSVKKNPLNGYQVLMHAHKSVKNQRSTNSIYNSEVMQIEGILNRLSLGVEYDDNIEEVFQENDFFPAEKKIETKPFVSPYAGVAPIRMRAFANFNL